LRKTLRYKKKKSLDGYPVTDLIFIAVPTHLSNFTDSLSRKEKQLKEIFSRSNFAEQSQDRKQLFRTAGAATMPSGGLADMGTIGWGAEPTAAGMVPVPY
jgi:hypothetical protein